MLEMPGWSRLVEGRRCDKDTEIGESDIKVISKYAASIGMN